MRVKVYPSAKHWLEAEVVHAGQTAVQVEQAVQLVQLPHHGHVVQFGHVLQVGPGEPVIAVSISLKQKFQKARRIFPSRGKLPGYQTQASPFPTLYPNVSTLF